MKQKILVIGGAGFIGQAICEQLAEDSYDFAALDRPGKNFSPKIKRKIKQDLFELSDQEMVDLLAKFTTVIYCLGPDDRAIISKDQGVYQFFEQNLVRPSYKITKLAAKAKLKKIIFLGSYFSYFNQFGVSDVEPGQLSEHHPYIRARAQQWQKVSSVKDIDKVLIQIPYVFGVVEGRDCLWKRVLIDRFNDSSRIIYGRGGTTVISIEKLAKIIVRAITKAQTGDELPVGEADLSFAQIFKPILKATDTNKKLIQPSNWLLNLLFKLQAIKNNHFGLDYNHLNQDILSQNFFSPWQQTDQKLDLDYQSDINQTLIDTGKKIKQLLKQDEQN